MVQKFTSPTRIYKYPFELVMMAYERRFPICPQMPIVLETVVIEDQIEEDGAKRVTKRRCKLNVDVPYLFKKIIGIDVAFFIQKNIYDMRARSLVIEAWNETFSSRIKIFERCRYHPHPENPDWTCFDQTADIEITNFFGFEHSMEKVGMKQYSQLISKGKEIIEYFINELKNEGITEVERWPEKTEVVINDENKQDTDNNNKINDSRKQSINVDIVLDADYIEKYLGDLSSIQVSKLLQLRQKMEEQEDLEKIPDYPTLLRFLRARDFNIEKASHMLLESLKWRQEHDVDNLLYDYHQPAVISKYFPGAWHGFAVDGKPLYILKLGSCDVKGLLKSMGEEGLLKLTLHICEEGLKLMEEQTKKHGRPIWNWCLLVDLDGLCMRHLWRPGVKALLRIIETVEKNYPETMGKVLICRAPRVFPILWTVVSAFIDEHTRTKFLFFGGPHCHHSNQEYFGLEHYIPQIPDFLGGPSTTLIHEGGLIPKSLYKTESVDHDDDLVLDTTGDDVTATRIQLNEHNLYQTAKLRPGQIHEVIIENNDPKSILTWDYESVNVDVLFTVYKTDQEILKKCNAKDEYTSIFDLSDMQENVNYKKVEPTVTSHSRESMQGSLEMDNGTYILQWMVPPTLQLSTQLMYFYEIISSANYKGSMTSLQSGLSALSVASSVQSR